MGNAVAFASIVLAAATSCGAMAQYSGAGGILNDALDEPAVTTFAITVLDEGTIGSFQSLTLTNFQHSWCGDVKITLTAPDASSVSIVDRIGYTGSLFGDSSNYLGSYAFADGGANIWTIATQQGNGTTFNIPTGTYAATGAGGAAVDLSAFFLGKSAFGTWTLTVTDFESGDTGSLGSWGLNFGVVPSPAGFGLLVLSLVRRSRRR
ncbi:MAG: proprotein convertase P-domain-containing protein [Phycisphaerae bacterium]|nr:proprotein convertase P-domain-containing protein [Phycisphaerae bacterium]